MALWRFGRSWSDAEMKGYLAALADRTVNFNTPPQQMTRENGWTVDGEAEVLDMPDALEPLVDYYRSISGEHPDWDEYRAAMTRQGKSLLRITVTGWGPVATGGFPPEVIDKL